MPTVMNRQTLGEDGSNFDAADAARVAWMKESRDHQAFLITGHTGQEQAICSMPRGNSAPSKARTSTCLTAHNLIQSLASDTSRMVDLVESEWGRPSHMMIIGQWKDFSTHQMADGVTFIFCRTAF